MAHSLDGLMKWLQRDEWRGPFEELLAEHIGDACEALDGDIDDLTALVGAEGFTVLWGCVFEDLMTRENEAGVNIAADYLKRRGFRETASSRAYMNALRNSVMSLYEISDLRPGESFLARDLIRGGEPVRVSERSGSRQLKPWDRIGGRVMPLGARWVIGGGILTFDHETADAAADMVRKAKKTLLKEVERESRRQGLDVELADAAAVLTDTAVLGAVAPMFTALWLESRLDHILNPPQLRNSDGETLLFTTTRYPLKRGATVTAARTALDALPGLRAETADFWNWIDEAEGRGSKKRTKAPPDKGLSIGSWLDDGSPVLGTIEIDGRSIVLQTNSIQRAERGAGLLDTALAGLIGAPEFPSQTMEDLRAAQMADEDPAGGEKAEDAVAALPDLPLEDQQKIIGEFMDRHYRALLDEPIAALGDKTPRACARTPVGRRKLAAWLKLLENGAATSADNRAAASYDLTWMWRELGVLDLRR